MRDRYTLWRVDAVTKLFCVVWPMLAVGGVIVLKDEPGGLSILLPGLGLIAAVAYLSGPSARVTVSPSEVVVVNPFEVLIVPVSRLRGWDQITGWQQPRLRVEGLARPVPVLAFQLNKTFMTTDTHEQWVRQRMRCIDRAVAEQTSVEGCTDVIRRRRWSTILVVVTVPLLYAAMLLMGRL
jgi:hypothetical protein